MSIVKHITSQKFPYIHLRLGIKISYFIHLQLGIKIHICNKINKLIMLDVTSGSELF